MEISYSFIIPHHNTPDLLQRCIDSIPERKDVEIIVIDDNSQEGKKANVKRKDVQTIYLDASHSKGAGHARNEGLAVAKGAWLLFADCDDYYNPNFLEVLDKYQNRRDIDVVYFNFDYIDASTKQLVLSKKYLQDALSNYQRTIEQSNIIKYKNFTPWTKMVRRSFSERHRMYFEEVQNGNDILYSLMLAFLGNKYIVEPSSIYVYLKQKNSIDHQKPSFDNLICRISHIVQVNGFLNTIGIKGTRKPVWYMVLGLLKNVDTMLSLRVLIYLFVNCNQFVKLRKEWFSIINDRKNIIG